MCLYPKMIKNRKYLPNKKNGGIVPTMTDRRVMYVPIGCGHCIECRQQKAREWQVRLSEEIKKNPNCYFVTLTFSEENIEKIKKAINFNGEGNAIAGYAVRHLLERYRKKHKKSIKHWLVTELGHQGTERIHLHGLLWFDYQVNNKYIEKIWDYGWTFTGNYVNQKTINYIIKYVSKVDNNHPNFESQIFCSAGLGAVYINENNKSKHAYRGEETIQYFTLPNGQKINMPIYYRNKIFTEKERELLWLNTLDEKKTYVRGIEIDISTEKGMQNYIKILKQQQKDNIALGYGGSSDWREHDYNTTLKHVNQMNGNER